MKKIFFLILSCICFSSKGQNNIIGGNPIDISKAPWQVSIKFASTGDHLGGGIIVAPDWIITSAHVVQVYLTAPQDIIIHAGSTNQTNLGTGQIKTISDIQIHPNYVYSTGQNDVALIHLTTPLIYNYNVCPIEYSNSCNVQSTDIFPNNINSAFITGWGEVSSTIYISDILQGKSIPIIDRQIAESIFFNTIGYLPHSISSDMIPFYLYGAGAGHGDSGGPAILDNNGNKIAIGACSWAAPYPAADHAPCVYHFIQTSSDWISTYTGITPDNFASLYMQDKPWDLGKEPNSINEIYASDDIWIRKQDDGLTQLGYGVNQDPEYYEPQSSSYNYIYVRVRNKGCQPSSGTEQLKLYWAKAATALSWPNHWNGSISVYSPIAQGNVPLGDIVNTLTIPIIQPGHAVIMKFPWKAIKPENYVGLAAGNPFLFTAEEPHHFCLLARIISTDDPMVYPETSDLGSNVQNNNNIIWKNISVVNINPNDRYNTTPEENYLVGASILIGDAEGMGGTYDLEFFNSSSYVEHPLTEEAEVKITLDNPVWEKWAANGFQSKSIEILNETKKQVLVKGNPAILKNLSFEPNERNLMNVSFNFLIEKRSSQSNFHYEVIQRNSKSREIVGGEEYNITVPHRNKFDADAGIDQEINLNQIVYLHAQQLTEMAVYNWYDTKGNLIYSGKDLSVSPKITEKYKLEVITSADGFKDYDSVEVKVKDLVITKIYPNPASSLLNIEYNTKTASSVYLMIVKHDGSSSNQYVLDVTQNNKQINVSNYQLGLYSVILICDGQVKDYKNVSIQ